jgi:hypothetical protein
MNPEPLASDDREDAEDAEDAEGSGLAYPPCQCPLHAAPQSLSAKVREANDRSRSRI